MTLEEQNRVTAEAKRKFLLLSHTPANRNECPCCMTPANTSILSLTLTKAPSQPVALFLNLSPTNWYDCFCQCHYSLRIDLALSRWTVDFRRVRTAGRLRMALWARQDLNIMPVSMPDLECQNICQAEYQHICR